MLRFRKRGTVIFSTYVLELQSLYNAGPEQLKSDDLLSDIDVAIDLNSGEAQKWEHKFHIVDGRWAWTYGALGLDDCSDIAVHTDLCFSCGLRVGSDSEWLDLSHVVAWFFLGADGERAAPSAPRFRPAHNSQISSVLRGPPPYLLELGPRVHMRGTERNDQSNDGRPDVVGTKDIFQELQDHGAFFGCRRRRRS